jgi:hypothetical protein
MTPMARLAQHGFAARSVGSKLAHVALFGSHRRQLTVLPMVIAAATCLGLVGAPQSWAAEEPSSIYDKAGVEHNIQCIKTTENKRVVVRGVEGNQLQAAGGGVTDPPEARETCSGGAGIRIQGIESVSAKGMTMYYTWPIEKGEQSPGFVWLSELASRPSVNIEYAHGNGASAPRPAGEPYYKITPEKIESEQGYKGGGTWYTYSVYGLPVGGAKFALMSWSWIDVNGGGIARAAVAEGQSFYPANVRPITENSYNSSGAANGTVTARYGFVNSGEKLVWGWMVTSHTFNGVCYNHMTYAGGGTPLPETLCPGVSTGAASGVTATQATFNGTVSPNGSDTHYYFQYGTTPSYGNTQPVPPGTDAGSSGTTPASTTVSLSPSTTYHYRVVASNILGTSYGGEQTFTTQAALNTSPSAPLYLSSTGQIFEFYVGANNQMYEWLWTGTSWTNGELAGGGEPVLAGTSPSAPLYLSSTGQIFEFYVGANNQMYEWLWTGTSWTNGELAGGGEPVGD